MGLHSIDGDIHFGGNGFVRLSIKNNIGNHPTGMLRKLSDRNMQLGTDAFLPFLGRNAEDIGRIVRKDSKKQEIEFLKSSK